LMWLALCVVAIAFCEMRTHDGGVFPWSDQWFEAKDDTSTQRSKAACSLRHSHWLHVLLCCQKADGHGFSRRETCIFMAKNVDDGYFSESSRYLFLTAIFTGKKQHNEQREKVLFIDRPHNVPVQCSAKLTTAFLINRTSILKCWPKTSMNHIFPP
jgi:hypothetical protein